ncbi:MAG: Grx4 family monothiol glutaredoxin [Pseudomonadota bacterium]
MSLTAETRSRIEDIVASNRVVLFMKGTPQQPQCGFSARTVGILQRVVGDDFGSYNVLADQEVREGIKTFSDWPTIPQLYVDGEFHGGCDLITEMFNRGDLHQLFGLPEPDRTPPEITITDGALEIIRGALDSNPGMFVHLSIDANWSHDFRLGPMQGHEIRTESNGITVLMDLESASKARGLELDAVENFGGTSLHVNNPNMPPPVQDSSPSDIKAMLDAGEILELIDVRTDDERARAAIEGSSMLDQAELARLEALPKDTRLVLYCHTGVRSAQAGEHFRNLGFTDVHNLSGGIDAWSKEVDTSVPRY